MLNRVVGQGLGNLTSTDGAPDVSPDIAHRAGETPAAPVPAKPLRLIALGKAGKL